jgi:hypothetical protein
MCSNTKVSAFPCLPLIPGYWLLIPDYCLNFFTNLHIQP